MPATPDRIGRAAAGRATCRRTVGFQRSGEDREQRSVAGAGYLSGRSDLRMDAGGQDRGDSPESDRERRRAARRSFLRLGPFAAPTLGGIPEQTVWFMNNMGLNTFIAIVGISTGPSFVAGFQQVGWSLFLVGAGATTLPLVLGVLIGRYLFRFNDALTLGASPERERLRRLSVLSRIRSAAMSPRWDIPSLMPSVIRCSSSGAWCSCCCWPDGAGR